MASHPTVEEYRTAVREVACPQCHAMPGKGCTNTYGKTNPVVKPIDHVHDDRCFVFWLTSA